ncbi:type VI secretion system Vgr protein [Listeria phage LIS04]|nr:type VI secretion system Vgr protein [Listeria phage LIS04]
MFRRARVEVNKDPKQLGRVRIRIPSIHGANKEMRGVYLEKDDLPWALPCVPGIAGEDFGTFVVPPVGSWVLVTFEDDNPQLPIYMGSIYGAGFTNPQPMMSYDGDGREWTTTPQKNQRPDDVFDGKTDNAPDRGVIFKSPKGHTIKYDDTTGEESFTLLDRAGQMIKFNSPVETTTPRRGMSSAEDDSQLDESPDASIELVSGKKVSGQVKTWIKVKDDNLHAHTKHDENKDTWLDIVADKATLKTEIPNKNSSVVLTPENSTVQVQDTSLDHYSYVDMTVDKAVMKTSHPDQSSWVKLTPEEVQIKTEEETKNSSIDMSHDRVDIKLTNKTNKVTTWIEMINDTVTLQILDNTGQKSFIKIVNGKATIASENSAGDSSGISVTPQGIEFEGNGSSIVIDKSTLLLDSPEIHFNRDREE